MPNDPTPPVRANVPGDTPDPVTKLTGWAKALTAVGVVGAFIGCFYIILTAMLDNAAEDRKLFRDALEAERERGEKNKDHGQEYIKQVYQRHREETKEMVGQIRENGATQKAMADTLRAILDQGKK